ncbi:alpha/beta fold hydrolase [Jannaschia sp. R86511]|uniref:alpha/beta fold hydrolase n=1 Tax=Jannaschia sp. R86511 TaxID=3093853 RepID=UPI0036D2D14A
MTDPTLPRLHRHGSGRPLVLVHGLGATHDCWRHVVPLLHRHREVVTFDLPGFGHAPPLPGPVTVTTLTDHVERLLARADLLGADLVGSSMGAEIVLELLRRGHGGDVVALAPSGYWGAGGRRWFLLVAWAALVLVTVLRPVAPAILATRLGREVLLRPLSPRPRHLSDVVPDSSRLFGSTPSFVPGLRHLGRRREPVTVPAERLHGRTVTVAWGRHDGLCLPGQAQRAHRAVPGAQLHWFERSGHLPPWDEPLATAELLLRATGGSRTAHVSGPGGTLG